MRTYDDPIPSYRSSAAIEKTNGTNATNGNDAGVTNASGAAGDAPTTVPDV